MRLHWLRVHNFRQFYGTSPKIELAHGKKNVTVIHGYNGSGKTALLNAFTWLMYGEFSAGFQQQEQLINKRAIREASVGESVEARVELMIEHIGKRYLITKTCRAEKAEGNSSVRKPKTVGPEMQWCDADGKWKEEKRPDDVIGRILPEDLHFYFFFDGERIEKIFNPAYHEKKDMSKALKQFLGIEPLERAERHLTKVKKHFEKELDAIGDPGTKEILERKKKLERYVEGLNASETSKELEIEAERKQKELIEEQLRENKETAELQTTRDRLKRDRDALVRNEKERKKELAQLISAKGYLVFLDKVLAKFHQLEESLRQSGELPAGIKRQFVQDLLEAEKCICGTDLSADSEHRRAIEAWLAKAGLPDVEEKLLKLGGRVAEFGAQKTDFCSRFEELLQRIEKCRMQRSAIEEELEEVHGKLGDSPDVHVRELEARARQAEDKVSDLTLELGGIQADRKRARAAIGKLEDEFEKCAEKQAKSKLAKRRYSAAREAHEVVKRMRLSLEVRNIQAIDKKLKEHFKRMTYVPYVPELSDDLSISLLESAGGDPMPVAASQGECQLMSFAFLATIIEYAREWQQKQDDIHHLDTSKYPIVMDSPFGSLDPYYREQISKHVPELADQVVLLVTLTQWRGEVEDELSSSLGKQYVLEYHSPEENIPDEVIQISGKSYPLIRKSSNEYEYTRVIEVAHG